MSKHRRASRRLQLALSGLLSLGSGLAFLALMSGANGCAQKQSVSDEAPASDAEMKKVVLNVFGMT